MHHRLDARRGCPLGKKVLKTTFVLDAAIRRRLKNRACFRLIRQHTTLIAVGEVFNSIWDCKQLIEEQLIDHIRTTLTHAGGITGMRRIADFAPLYRARTGSYGRPICRRFVAWPLHYISDLWVPNLVCRSLWATRTDAEVFPA